GALRQNDRTVDPVSPPNSLVAPAWVRTLAAPHLTPVVAGTPPSADAAAAPSCAAVFSERVATFLWNR
ncbi:MAG: hypothetical protein WBV82_24555, partial [Myxococcaceae bacterium]